MNVNRTGAGIGTPRVPWNKGKLIGQKPPLKLKEIWDVRIRLQIAHRVRDLALFNLAIDSKLRGCDLVRLRVCDIVHGERIVSRATVMQRSNFLYGESRSGRFESAALCPWLTTLAGR